jgi:hypothetical protein
MGLLVPFYAANFADKNLPASDAARIGLLSSVACFVFTWAVRLSPMELSSGVVAATVLPVLLMLFLVHALSPTIPTILNPKPYHSS